jgi:hypothetical protein
VQTRILEQSGELADLLSRDSALTPEQVADAVWRGLGSGEALILPHPEVRDYYIRRATDTDAWLAGMNRLEQKLESAAQQTTDPATPPNHPSRPA